MEDIREGPARFYDLSPNRPNDIPFYLERLPSPRARVLELGCGTGRVSIPLARHCALLLGVDRSRAMLDICRSKAAAAGLGEDRLRVDQADISAFELHDRFDLIIAPFRVIQNLETDAQLEGLPWPNRPTPSTGVPAGSRSRRGGWTRCSHRPAYTSYEPLPCG